MDAIDVTVLAAVCRDDGRFLVQTLTDPKAGPFRRPIGGTVRFGEASDAALEREFREELDVDLDVGRPLGTLENRFTFAGEEAHELVILRAASFTDPTVYDRGRLRGEDAGGAIQYEATWRSVTELRDAEVPCYPRGIVGLLEGSAGRGYGHVTHP